MVEIAPFAAIRYDHVRWASDISRLIAPPYDVLDQADKDALLSGSPDNIAGVDLPHVPPKDAGPPEVYAQAARRLEDMLARSVLVREAEPALYVYHQAFSHGGRPYTRRKFIARVRLRPFSDGVILPHEHTFGGPKEDRLALMKATRCNLSPIFGLYTDPEQRIIDTLAGAAGGSPDYTATLDGVRDRVWIVRDPEIIGLVIREMADRKIYIADGHHRYGTALMYRDFAAGQRGGSLPADHPAQFCMFVLGSMDDPGSLILPYYRVLPDISLEKVLAAWAPGTKKTSAPGDLTLMDPVAGRGESLAFTDRDVLRRLEPNQSKAWCRLDYAYLHRFLIDELLAKSPGKTPGIIYVKSAEAALEQARAHRGVALMPSATPMAHLRAVSEAGGLMPQKSTYFYPKLSTGITIHPLY